MLPRQATTLFLFVAVCLQELNAQITFEATPNALAHVFKKEMRGLEELLVRIRPGEIRSTYLGLELTIDHLQIVDVDMPKIHYETATPELFNLKLIGGSARVLGRYSAVYKTKREGQFEFLLNNIDFSTPMIRDNSKWLQFRPSRDECILEVDDAAIIMTPTIPDQITNNIRTRIIQKMNRAACDWMTSLAETAEQRLARSIEMLDISQGHRPSIVDVRLLMLDDDHDQNNFKISISDALINSELSKLYYGANTRLMWDKIPEVIELLDECPEKECRALEDLDIISTLRDRPTFKIEEEDEAIVDLKITTTIQHHGNELFTIDTDLQLAVLRIQIEPPSDGFIDWFAKYKLKSFKTLKSNASPRFSPTLRKLVEKVDEMKIESVLSNYLRGSLPIRIDNIHWHGTHHAHFDKSNQQLSFHISPHFSPPLTVF